MNKQVINMMAGIIILVITGLGFYWLWSSSKAPQGSVSIPTNLQVVEIESIKSKAQKIMADKENNSSMPIPVPGQDKVGRDNPFGGL